eukprot:scaffold31652_cov59-Phaeocystis_antarctica.AAC.3
MYHAKLLHRALLPEQRNRLLGALAPARGHRRQWRAAHACDARRTVVERHRAHAYLHDWQQLGHNIRRRGDLDRVDAALDRLAKVHRLGRDELLESRLHRGKGLDRVSRDDALRKGLDALHPLHARIEPPLDRLGQFGQFAAHLEARAVLLQLELQHLLLLLLVIGKFLLEDDESSRRLHLGRLEDGLEQHLPRAPQLAPVLLAHRDQLERVCCGDRRVLFDPVELILLLPAQRAFASHLEEEMLEHTSHLDARLEWLAPLLRVRHEQHLDQIRCRFEVRRRRFVRVLDLAVQNGRRPSGKSLEVTR